MADILLDNLPRTWAGRPIDWDFRPMVWFNGQYLRLPEDEKGLPELARETMRRFYCVAVPPEEEVDAFKALVEFYTAGPQEVADRPGSSRTEELALDYVTDGPAIVAAFQQAYGIDLTRARLHWWRFKALMSNLPEETQLVKIIGFRTAVSGRRAGAACRAEGTLRAAHCPAERRRSHCHPARPQRSLCGPLPALTAPRCSAPCAVGLCRSGPSRKPAPGASGSNARTRPAAKKSK